MFSSILFGFLIGNSASAITLEEAFKAALQNNETIRQDIEHVNQSKEHLTQVKSTVYPNVALNASYLTQPKPRNPIAQQFFPENQATANLTLKQPLFRGFREFATIRQQKNQYQADQQTRMASLLMIYETVASRYLEILALEQDVRNLNEQLEIYGSRVKDLQGRARRGESNSSEGLTAQSTQAALEADIRMTQSKLQSSRENFRVMTGLPLDVVLEDQTNLDRKAVTPKPLQEYLGRIEERPDVKSAREMTEASKEGVSIAKGGHWPSLDLIGNYYLERPKGYLSEIKWDVQVLFTLPLFEGGLRNSQTREAASKNRQEESRLIQIRKQAEADIRSLHESLMVRGEQLAALKRSAELAEKNYQVLQRDSRRGLSRSLDVQIALTEFRVSRRGFDQARYQAQLDRIRLELAAAYYPDALLKEE